MYNGHICVKKRTTRLIGIHCECLMLKPIFHCNVKPLALVVCIGQYPQGKSQWNMVQVGYVRAGVALGMYIACCLCRFQLC